MRDNHICRRFARHSRRRRASQVWFVRTVDRKTAGNQTMSHWRVAGGRLAVLHVQHQRLQVPGRHDPARAASAAGALRLLLRAHQPQGHLRLFHVPQVRAPVQPQRSHHLQLAQPADRLAPGLSQHHHPPGPPGGRLRRARPLPVAQLSIPRTSLLLTFCTLQLGRCCEVLEETKLDVDCLAGSVPARRHHPRHAERTGQPDPVGRRPNDAPAHQLGEQRQQRRQYRRRRRRFRRRKGSPLLSSVSFAYRHLFSSHFLLRAFWNVSRRLTQSFNRLARLFL